MAARRSSEKSGKRRRATPKVALPAFFEPQLATLVKTPPPGEDWIHELKLDGYRLLLRFDGQKAQVHTRAGNNWTETFPAVAAAAQELGRRPFLIDGEAVVVDRDGRSSFGALQEHLSIGKGAVTFFAFDLLWLDGLDLRKTELVDRKEALRAFLAESTPTKAIAYLDHIEGQGDAFFEEACRAGVEGIVSKRANEPYRSGRSRSWLKTKCVARQEFIVVGWTDPGGSRVGFGSLLLGYYDAEGTLIYAGKVGTGFTADTLLALKRRLAELVRPDGTLRADLQRSELRAVHWVRPELVVEVEFTEWTRHGTLRHPSFQGLRIDKRARDVVRERPATLG